jgi:NAD(P)-dependent dehydrogenase (short-subunit alcohol dehydrogenase family)
MGRASARLFAREGATVFIAGRNRERGEALVAEINADGGKAHFAELDVVHQEQWDAAVAQVKEKAKSLHILMNIVGSNAMVRFPEVDVEQWNKLFETNVTAVVRGIQTCTPLIRDSGGGSIVNIGSVAGITGNFGTGYSSSKWALQGVSRSAAYVYADWGIRANVIQPGWIETDLTASMESNPLVKKMQESMMNNTVLLRRSGKAEEIATRPCFWPVTSLPTSQEQTSWWTADGSRRLRTSPTNGRITCSSCYLPRTRWNMWSIRCSSTSASVASAPTHRY